MGGPRLQPSPFIFPPFSSLYFFLFSYCCSLFVFLLLAGWRICVCVRALISFSLSLAVSHSSSLSLLVGHAIKGPLPSKLLSGKARSLDNLGEIRVLWVNVHRPQHGLKEVEIRRDKGEKTNQ